MNCRKGDLALVLSGPSAGQMVTCLESLPAGWQRDDLPPAIRQRGGRQQIAESAGALWRVDREIEWGETAESRRYGLPTRMHVVPDRALMPIRPDGESDQQERTTENAAVA